MEKLPPSLIERLRTQLPETASACVRAIVMEVPGYDRGFDRSLRFKIERAVQQALGSFLNAHAQDASSNEVSSMTQGAYRLGHGEAVAGRSMDALLAAYRVGARVAWDSFAKAVLADGQPAELVAQLASETFAFIDQLSAASLSGHTDALTQRSQELSRRRDQLAAALAAGEPASTLEALAQTAHWNHPATITALVLGQGPSARLESLLGTSTLWVPGGSGYFVALIPDLSPSRRSKVLGAARPAAATLGPAAPWTHASESVLRAQRAHQLTQPHPELPHESSEQPPTPPASSPARQIDSEDILPELALGADAFVASLLADRALEPLAGLSSAKRLMHAETLLAWLAHQGRREDVAAALHVHPQTVRYRMNQLRDLYGDRLTDPRQVLELMLGLVVATNPELHTQARGWND